MFHYKTNAPICLGGTLIPAELSALIAPLVTGRVRQLDITFALEVDEFDLERCVFCLTPIALYKLASGEWFGAEVETDNQGITRAELTRVHQCAESVRFDDFLRSSSDGLEPEPEDGNE